MTADQLEASANEPWTSTTVGLGAEAAFAGPAAMPTSRTATSRPMIHAGTLRRLVVTERSMVVLSSRDCTRNYRLDRDRSHLGMPWSAPGAASTGAPEAEGAGFEPAVRLHGLRFSRPAHSTTLPPLRGYKRTSCPVPVRCASPTASSAA